MKNTGLYKDMLRELKWVLRYVSRYKFTVLLYIVIGLVGTALSLGTAVASKYLIDAVVSHADRRLAMYAVLTIGLAVFQYVFTALSSWVTAVVGSKVSNSIREEIYTNIISAKWEEIHSYHSGDLLNRIEGDVSTVSSGVIGFIPSAFTRILQFAGSLVIVLYYDRIMALLSLLSAPFLFAVSRVIMRTIRKYNSESRDLNGKVLSFSEESFRNIQVIKAFDLTKQYVTGFRTVLENYRKIRLKYEKFSVILTFVLSVIGLVVSYLCYGWGVYRLWQGIITFGTMTLFLQISGNLSSSFSSIAGLFPQAVSIATSAGRIIEVTGCEKENDRDRDKALSLLKKSKGKGVDVTVDNVSFMYSDGDTEVLSNISFSVRPGETVALTGTSGEGKTTILKLLLGLVEPTGGKISLSCGDDILDVSDSTRRFFSYIPQNNGIFSGTIEENLKVVKQDATDEELEEVLRAADIWDFVSSLPDGIKTQIGEMSDNISAGQAQRLSIARSLLKKAPILLMDEATSALDSETESRVLHNIMVNDPTRVCILTTHRESALQYCTRVYRAGADGHLTLL